VADIFDMQDEIVARLANSLGYELVKAEAEKGARSNNPDVIDLTMHGWALIWRAQLQPATEKRGSFNEARALCDQALEIDPNDANALAGSAYTYYQDYIYGWSGADTDYEAKALGQANRANALAPDNLRAYLPKALYLSMSRRPNEALGATKAGLAINPNFVPLLVPRIIAQLSLGRFEQANADEQLAMRLSPRDPYRGVFYFLTGAAELSLGHLDAALDAYRKAIDSGHHTSFGYSDLSAAYALVGMMDEAKAALAEARRLNPKLTVKWLIEHSPGLPAVLDGVRKAGLPEE
jgi:adenylate cyclase